MDSSDTLKSIHLYPTDTVWGMGGHYLQEDVHDRILEIKRRELKPFSLLLSNMEMLHDFLSPHLLEKKLGKNYLDFFCLETTILWPLDQIQKDIPYWICFDSPLLGIRLLPNSELLFPISSTSLNISGEDPIVSEKEAFNFSKRIKETFYFPKLPFCPNGKASTIVSFEKELPVIVREGARVEDVQSFLDCCC